MTRPSYTVLRIKSFAHAMRGIGCVIGSQANAKLHLSATVTVMAFGWLLRVSLSEWCWLAIAVGSVWAAEGFNTAIEILSDVVSPERHPKIRDVKDVAAGAVLSISIAAACVGLIVFIPHFAAVIRGR